VVCIPQRADQCLIRIGFAIADNYFCFHSTTAQCECSGDRKELGRDLIRRTPQPFREGEGNREIKVSKFEALAKRLMANALKGDIKSLLELLKLDDELFGANDATLESGDAITSPTETDLAILRDFFAPEATYGEEDDDDSA
jgi:hypothetical protein